MTMPNGRILTIDDDPDIREVLEDRLTAQGFEVVTASSGKEGLQRIRTETLDLVILDLQMPDMGGMAVLQQMKEEQLDITVVVLTAYGSIQRAVEAMRAGAFDFITKPFEPDRLQVVVEKGIAQERLQRENARLREAASATMPTMIAESPVMRDILKMAQRASESSATILLLGESGVGKEVLARSIHHWSTRRDRPFVAVNCMALADTLLESELFGHEKGAFTGAARQKKGKFEAARTGTILLDEIGATKLDFQLKLLRVLQDGDFERVGGEHVIRADARVIAATNRDLKKAITEGAFLDDLYYRLNVVSITVPPLRDRRDDIPALSRFFLSKYAHEAKRDVIGFTDDALAALLLYAWPGNIRELENAIERAVVLGGSDKIRPQDLPDQVVKISSPAHEPSPVVSIDDWLKEILQHGSGETTRSLLEVAEEQVIRAVVSRVNGNQSKAARILGIDRKKVGRRMAKYGIAGE